MASRSRTWLSVILCFAFILNGLPFSAPIVSASSRASQPALGLPDPSPQNASSVQGNEAVARAKAALVVSDNPSTGSHATASALIAITASGFEPAAISVEAGTEVVWKNETAQTHVLKSGEPYAIYLPLILRQTPGASALSASARLSRTTPLRTASDDFVATISPGGTFSHTFITEGEYPYYLVTDFKQRGRVAVTGSIPPDPGAVAPPVDPTVPTTVISSTLFLYTGPDPIQTGVNPGTIEARRVAVLRGRVLTNSGAPLPGVTVTILDHPEFGQTLTRADGMYDMAVNGGGLLTINYEKPNYLPAQRQVQTPWEDYVWLDDLVLIGVDSNVTEIDLTSSVPIQVAQGSVVSDDDGTRQATLLIPKGTAAELVLPGGITQTLTTLNVRATEYTIGDHGPQAMPAELPAQSGYTYAVELSADEAIAAKASDVRFSQPLYFYIENFLDFPVGGIVPVGYYDRERGAWIPSQNGRIIKIVSITGGLAEVDTDGDGVADNGAGLGITDAERQELGARYAPGQSLWRVPVAHFTPWDCNWPYTPETGAQPPDQPDPDQKEPPVDDPCHQVGSIIECESQTLRQAIPIAGTPFTLNYGSDRVPDRTAERTLQIDLSGASVPSVLRRIELEVRVAGRRFTRTFAASPNQWTTFTWDGLDAYDRPVQGRQPISTRIDYVYGAVYVGPAAFGQAFGAYSGSGAAISTDWTRKEFRFSQEWQGYIGGLNAAADGMGGWELNIHHFNDEAAGVVYQGDGRQRKVANLNPGVIATVAGQCGQGGYSGDGGPATEARLTFLQGVDVGPDESIYIADYWNHAIRRVGPDRIITTIAGTGVEGSSGDSGPATQARLSWPPDVVAGPDNMVYVLNGNSVRRIGLDGIIWTIAGAGGGYYGDGGPAALAGMSAPQAMAIARDGSMYIADYGNHVIRRIGQDGIITTVAGNGTAGYSGDGGPAIQARLKNPYDVAVGPDGSIYIADSQNYRIRRVDPDGIITTVAGNGTYGYGGDGGLATNARLTEPSGVAIGPDGGIYIADYQNHRVRRVAPNGTISTFAGTTGGGYSGDGGPPTQAKLNGPITIAFGPDGSAYISDHFNYCVRRVAPTIRDLSVADALIASEDGEQLYVFDGYGRHARTLHALTGAVIYGFTYDKGGRLASVTDGDNNTTTIERDETGQPAAIVAPFGQRTQLGLNTNGYLSNITNPAGETVDFTYTADGLMTSMTDARNGTHTFAYDALGRLIGDQDPATGAKTLVRVQSSQGYTVTVSSALGRQTSYSIERRSVGGTIRRTTGPDGTRTESTIGTDGSTVTRLPDGMVINLLEGPDPRFGMQAALPKSRTVTTPGGHASTTTTERTVTLSNPDDILSLTSLTDRVTVNGRAYTSAYDAASRTFTDTSPAGRVRTTTIDSQGRVIREQTTGLEPVAYAYDARGRLETITQGIGAAARITHLTYDSQGYLETIVDPLNRTVRIVYDAAGRVTQQILPDNRVIGYAYDANSNVTSVTPPGRPAHSFTYNSVDLEASYNPPDVGLPQDQTFNTYNLDRQVTRIALPSGQNLDFGYDSTTGKLSTLTITRGTVSYGYQESSGLLASVAAPDGITLGFNYDGSVLTNESWTGPVAGGVGRTYDNDLRVTGLTVNGANAITYQYDADSLLTQAGALTLARDPQNGLPTGTTLGSMADTWSYNGFGEPSAYAATYGGTAVYDVEFTRDALGRITGKTETIGGVTDAYAYDYDLAGRLISATKNGVTISTYTYDSNGNRLSYTGEAGIVSGSYDDQDRLLQYGAATYAYTADGRLLSKTSGSQTTGYQYDELGNLTSVSLPGGPQIDYLIDGSNRRIGKKVDGVLVQGFLYQSSLEPIAELDGAGSVVSRFVYGSRANVPDYMIKGGITYRIIADHLGSPRLVIDAATGAVAQRMDYDAFGLVLLDTNPSFQPFGFAGGIYDRETGLVRFGARDYDAVIGRWTAKDPLLFSGGESDLFTYVANDPVNFVDPWGLDSTWTEDLKEVSGWLKDKAADIGLGKLKGWGLDKAKELSGIDVAEWLKRISLIDKASQLISDVGDMCALPNRSPGNPRQSGRDAAKMFDKMLNWLGQAVPALNGAYSTTPRRLLDWAVKVVDQHPTEDELNRVRDQY